MFCLFDATRFYSEASIIYKPQLRNVPILVSAGQGISIAANRACTRLQISKFTPIWEELDKLRLHNGLIYKANFNSLSHISDRFMSCIELNAKGSTLIEQSFYHILLGDFNGTPNINPDEVSEWKWMSLEAIEADMKENPQRYTEWFKIIFDKFYNQIER